MDAEQILHELPTISISTVLNTGSYEQTPDGGGFLLPYATDEFVALMPFNTKPGPGLTAALLDGVQPPNPQRRVTPLFQCASRNCTWTPFPSLSICSACNDVTHHLIRKTVYSEDDSVATFGNNNTMKNASSGNYTSYSLPYITLTNKDVGGLDAFLVADTTTNPGITVSFQYVDMMIMTVGIIESDSKFADGDISWKDTNVTASECALYFCTRVYVAKVNLGTITESVVGSWAYRNNNSYLPTDEDNTFTNATMFTQYEISYNHSLWGDGVDFYRTDLQLQIPPEEAARVNLQPGAGLTFNVSQHTIGSTMAAINNYLFTPSIIWPLLSIGTDTPFNPILAEVLYMSQNYSATFDTLAASLTNWVRDSSNETITGTSHKWVMHINVQWGYLCLPLLVHLTGCLFVILSMIQTRKLQLQPWKTDVAATLVHSLDVESRAKLRSAHGIENVKEMASKMIMKFEDGEDGLELKVLKQNHR